MPSHGRKAKVPGGHTVAITGYVLLPFEVAGEKEICVSVFANETLECYLSADFIRTFGMIHDSVKNQLIGTDCRVRSRQRFYGRNSYSWPQWGSR